MSELPPPTEKFRRYARGAELLRLYLQEDDHAADLMLGLVPDEELRCLAEALLAMAGMCIQRQEEDADQAIEFLTWVVGYVQGGVDHG